MSSRTKLLIWIAVAVAASALFALVLVWQHQSARARWSTFLVGYPHEGARLFRGKGCAQCHAVNGVGGRSAPDLGFEQPPRANINQLVVAMWNHAPRMWDRMQETKLPYPAFDPEEMAHLFAYLYSARYMDEPGDVYRGEQLFAAKGCIRCHAIHGRGGHGGPDLLALRGLETPIAWTQAMWNHAPTMESVMEQRGLAWPRFEGPDMNDLLAYIRSISAGRRREFELLPADPDRGWKLFQDKSCIACHSVKGEGGRIGPELGPRREYALTVVQFAGLMWNHSPEMWRQMKAQGIARPSFQDQEMADLIAFLHRLRYFEPGGSSQMGEVLFAKRGCARCHGPRSQGSPLGPALRGHREPFTSTGLAEALWRHGPKMYQRSRQLGLPWPTLEEGDVGDLVIFLNTPPEKKP